MATFETNSNSKGIFFLGLFIALAMVVSSGFFVYGIVKIKLASQKKIYAKGSAERRVFSDLGILEINISTKDADLKVANEGNRVKREQVLVFLAKHGVASSSVAISPPSVADVYKHVVDEKGRLTETWDGYKISQSIGLDSKDVNLIQRIYDAQGEILDQGILVNFSPPKYLFTNTVKIKMELLAEATKNARERAEQIVKNSGAATKIGALRSSSQGIFQITPLYSTETSGEGMNDVSSLEKSIRVVVSVEYALE